MDRGGVRAFCKSLPKTGRLGCYARLCSLPRRCAGVRFPYSSLARARYAAGRARQCANPLILVRLNALVAVRPPSGAGGKGCARVAVVAHNRVGESVWWQRVRESGSRLVSRARSRASVGRSGQPGAGQPSCIYSKIGSLAQATVLGTSRLRLCSRARIRMSVHSAQTARSPLVAASHCEPLLSSRCRFCAHTRVAYSGNSLWHLSPPTVF